MAGFLPVLLRAESKARESPRTPVSSGLMRWKRPLWTQLSGLSGYPAPGPSSCLTLYLLSFHLFLSSGNPTATAEAGELYQGDF